MSFKINLKPFPGAFYFTVREHLRKFQDLGDTGKDLEILEVRMRELFNISSEYQWNILKGSEKDDLLNNYNTGIIKDDPQLGINHLASKSFIYDGLKILDLSFSYPQVDAMDRPHFDMVIIDTNASLGIPNEFLVVFNRNDSVVINSISEQLLIKAFKKEIYVLARVLDDLKEKGIEVLLRESNYKAAVLYQLIESCEHLRHVVEKENRSKTMIVAECEMDFLSQIENLGYELSYTKSGKKTRITIANYPTQSKELIEMFADRVATS